jgi:hypothetical protein
MGDSRKWDITFSWLEFRWTSMDMDGREGFSFMEFMAEVSWQTNFPSRRGPKNIVTYIWVGIKISWNLSCQIQRVSFGNNTHTEKPDRIRTSLESDNGENCLTMLKVYKPFEIQASYSGDF